MTVWERLDEKITKKGLRSLSFNKIGWGSPMTRKQKKTDCYSRLFDSDYRKGTQRKEIVYFPIDWEGQFSDGKYDMRGCVYADMDKWNKSYRMRIGDSMMLLRDFINLVKKEDEDELEQYRMKKNW